MRLKLLKPSRINHVPGDIVEVSPEQGAFLLSVGAAVCVAPKTGEKAEKAEQAEKAEKEEKPKRQRKNADK